MERSGKKHAEVFSSLLKKKILYHNNNNNNDDDDDNAYDAVVQNAT